VIYKVTKRDSIMYVAVSDQGGTVVATESPTHPCFNPDFEHQPWSEVRPRLEEEGFTITEGGQA
jgi:hypothetical protein